MRVSCVYVARLALTQTSLTDPQSFPFYFSDIISFRVGVARALWSFNGGITFLAFRFCVRRLGWPTAAWQVSSGPTKDQLDTP